MIREDIAKLVRCYYFHDDKDTPRSEETADQIINLIVEKLTVMKEFELGNTASVFPEGVTGRVGLAIIKAQLQHTIKEIKEGGTLC